MRFSPRALELLDRTKEIELETQAGDGRVHRTVVWVVVDGSDVFVRSWRGPSARWYRETIARPRIAVVAGDRRLETTAVAAVDADSIRRTSEGFERKYPGDPATHDMVADAVLGTTLRLEAV
ncbi:MAG TPA: DUF2255 family protein [Candidatus Dormibacteraeota bacterium]|nr:DUF2255 family protein [Candidatus Dormibacteraeota bacterium]